MRVILKNIALWSVLLAFLVSASGFRLVKHTCASCNIVEYSLHNPVSCCETKLPAETPEQASCCSIETDPASCATGFAMDSCCEFESNFIVIDELLAPASLKVEAAIQSLPLQKIQLDLPEDISEEKFFDAFRHPPPPVFSGTDYLVYLHQLKIAFC